MSLIFFVCGLFKLHSIHPLGPWKKLPGPSFRQNGCRSNAIKQLLWYSTWQLSKAKAGTVKKTHLAQEIQLTVGTSLPTNSHQHPTIDHHQFTSIWKFGLEGPWFELHFPSAAGCCMHSSACIVHLHVPTSKYKNRALHHHLLMWQQVLLVYTFIIIHYIFTQMITRMYAYCCLTTSFGYPKLQNTDIPLYFAPEIRII